MMCAQYAACAMTQHLRGKYTYYILYDKGIYCFFSKKAFAGGCHPSFFLSLSISLARATSLRCSLASALLRPARVSVLRRCT